MAISTFVPSWRDHTLSPKAIIRNERYQPRAALDEKQVNTYASAMQRNVSFPPIAVAAIGRGKLYVIDGFHRLEAALRSGQDTIAAQVARMSEKDAVAYSLDANSRHGLNLNNKDKQRIFAKYLAEGLHLDTRGPELDSHTTVKALRHIRSDLDNLVSHSTISVWLRKAGIEPRDFDEITPWPADYDENEDREPSENSEDDMTLDTFNTQLVTLESLFASLSSSSAQGTALWDLTQLLHRLDGKEKAPDLSELI